MIGERIDADAFNAFEAAGWESAAGDYTSYLAGVTAAFAEPLLDAAGVEAGTEVLDVATGPGVVAAAAVRRGARVVGVDIADSMVRIAAERHPEAEFRQGDAEALPFPDQSFDAAVFGFGLLHMGRPERAAAELARVVRPGGRVALTVWNVPARSRLHGVVFEALAEVGGEPPADAPVGPPLFRFADDAELARLLEEAGFGEVEIRVVESEHSPPSADALWEGILGGALRLRATVVAQEPELQQRTREAFERNLAREGASVRVSAKLAAGVRT
jgi:ubiquinone/menaquinone biosynthesis C-methylase UbiE